VAYSKRTSWRVSLDFVISKKLHNPSVSLNHCAIMIHL